MRGILLLAALGAGAGVAREAGPTLHPPQVAPRPLLPRPERFDRDHDLLDDALEARLARTAPEQPVKVELVMRRVPSQRQLDAFVHAGGRLLWVFQSVSLGFWGEIAAKDLPKALDAVGRDSLLLVAGDAPMVKDLDKATRNARARPVWAPGFAGNAQGFNGSPTTTIGVIDTGIDATHADLQGRMAYWKDFEGTLTTPRDLDGHGTCVSSVAFGTGAAFEDAGQVLRFTRGNTLTGFATGAFPGRAPLTFGTAPITAQITSIFDGVNDGKVAISSAGAPNVATRSYSTLISQAGPSPLTMIYTFTPAPDRVYSTGTPQTDGGTIDWTVVSAAYSPYPKASDALPTFRGMAPGCQWAMAHAADDIASVEMALDDLMTQRQAISLKVVNISQSPDTDGGPTLLADKITTLSQGGVLVVKTAGNTGRSSLNPYVTPSGLTALALTVGASNLDNQLTQYTSVGVVAIGANEDMKPDLLAPGGSLLAVDMICADSNDGDNPDGGWPDQVHDDYQPEEGTSFAAPMVAGAAALVIQGLESQGYTWDYNSADGPKRVKSVLLATATETNQPREAPPSIDPPLGRSQAQKDRAEGYGVLNVDAALEGLLQSLALPETGSTDGGVFERRAWGRKVPLTPATPFEVVLEVGPAADFDLYLYGGGSDPAGNPVLLAASDDAGLGASEALAYTPTTTETGLLVVKRISGFGYWNMGPKPVCGNGVKELGEQCDDTAGCCEACARKADGTLCPNGACKAGACLAPLCGDSVVVPPEQCDDGNTRSGDCCSATCQKEADGALCTGGACSNGVCQAPNSIDAAGDGGVLVEPAAKGCGCGSGEGAVALWVLGLALSRRRRRSAAARR